MATTTAQQVADGDDSSLAIEIVDAHHHLWGLETHSWLATVEGHPAGDFGSIKSYYMDAFKDDMKNQNVVASVHIQCWFDGEFVGETKWLQALADQHGFPQAIVACADLADEGLDVVLDEHCKYANVRGIRQFLDWHPTQENRRLASRADLMEDPNWLRGLASLESRGLTFDMQIYPTQMAVAMGVVRSYPGLQFVLNHAGFPLPDELDIWRDGMQGLASCPNVTVKLSGWSIVDNGWSEDSIRPLIMFAIDQFGVDRCMFASDFPVDKLHGTYDQWFAAYKSITADMVYEDRKKLFSGNAQRVYRLNNTQS